MSDDPATELVSLRTAAAELSLHYMTVYRYVRTGRLPAAKVEGEWRVRRADLEALTSAPAPAEPGTRSRFRSRLQDRLLAADELGAWSVIEAALASGADPEEVYLRLLIPAMRDIGDRWEAGDLAVLDEHQATAVATRLVGRMGPRFRRPGRRRGTIVIGAISGDTHALAPAMLADLLRGRGFEVVDLGGDTPAESFIEVCRSADSLLAVVLSCSSDRRAETIGETILRLREAECTAPILVGGAAVGPDRGELAGADFVGATAEEALDRIEALTGGPAPPTETD
jgi:excisionase family DNA binding protein